ncbi:MAG: hypothetical protein ACOY0T_09490 [Myxococcota bacterium]
MSFGDEREESSDDEYAAIELYERTVFAAAKRWGTLEPMAGSQRPTPKPSAEAVRKNVFERLARLVLREGEETIKRAEETRERIARGARRTKHRFRI